MFSGIEEFRAGIEKFKVRGIQAETVLDTCNLVYSNVSRTDEVDYNEHVSIYLHMWKTRGISHTDQEVAIRATYGLSILK